MTAFLKRIAFALGLQKREPEPEFDIDEWMANTHVMVPAQKYDALVADAEKWRASQRPAYLDDFGANVPVEDLGGQPVYPGREHAP